LALKAIKTTKLAATKTKITRNETTIESLKNKQIKWLHSTTITTTQANAECENDK
jgi:hypothetical protein